MFQDDVPKQIAVSFPLFVPLTLGHEEKLDLKRDIRETQLENEGQVKMLIQAPIGMMGWCQKTYCTYGTYGSDIIDSW